MTEGSGLIRGLEGVVAAETKLCDLDGANGRLAYCGYDIAELARLASFEEVCHLLWHGELPKPAQLDSLVVGLTIARQRAARVAADEPELKPIFADLQSVVRRWAAMSQSKPRADEAWQKRQQV